MFILNCFLEADKDPKEKELKDIIKRYKTPPPLPKRTDSIARNIDKYFNTDLLKSGEAGEEKKDLEVIEHRILGDETEENLTDDQVEDFEEGKLFLVRCV